MIWSTALVCSDNHLHPLACTSVVGVHREGLCSSTAVPVMGMPLSTSGMENIVNGQRFDYMVCVDNTLHACTHARIGAFWVGLGMLTCVYNTEGRRGIWTLDEES